MKILGLSLNSHDSSVCLIKNGRINTFFLSERFTKVKHDSYIPNELVSRITHRHKIDAVTYAGLSHFNFYSHYSLFFDNENVPPAYCYTDKHHLSHASISFYRSGFENALCFVIDGFGSEVNDNLSECESIYFFDSKGSEELIYKNITIGDDFDIEHSFTSDNDEFYNLNDNTEYKNLFGIGQIYESTANLIRCDSIECGKPMGLSSYGKYDKDYYGLYKKENTLNNNYFKKDKVYNLFKNKTGNITSDNYQCFADYCNAIQKQTQRAVGDLIEKYTKKVKTNNICLSGGYAMNVVANYYLLKRFPNLNFYFEPMCGDGGISIGSAMNLYSKLRKTYHPKIKKNNTIFFHGVKYDLSSYKKNKKTTLKDVAELLYNNNSVAVFNGYAEAGQRALGNRSILYNALDINAKDVVNEIKKREWYRPFGAMVLEEDAYKYFNMSLMASNPFMTVAFPVITNIIPGITHVDGTCRIQTVSKKQKQIYNLLNEFKKISGHGILLNTSLNLAGDPLAETPLDAFEILNKSPLDYLYFPEIYSLYK